MDYDNIEQGDRIIVETDRKTFRNCVVEEAQNNQVRFEIPIRGNHYRIYLGDMVMERDDEEVRHGDDEELEVDNISYPDEDG